MGPALIALLLRAGRIPLSRLAVRPLGTLAASALLWLALGAPSAAQVWEFNAEGDREGWSARNNVGGLLSRRGALSADITGDDPQVQGPASTAFSATGRRWLHVRMRVTSGSYAELFWSTLLNWSFTQSRSVRFAVTPDNVWRDYVVDMSANSSWTGTIRQLRFDPSEASAGRFEIDFIRLTGTRPFIGWEFDRPGDAEGWSAANALTGPAVSGGMLRAVVSGADPYFTGPPAPEIDAAAFRWLHVRMKAPGGSEAEFFWGTPSEPWHSPGRRVGFPVVADGEFHEYAVDLSSHPAWTGTVILPRLDPSASASSGVAEVDFIRLTSQLPPARVQTGPALPGRFALQGEEVPVTATVFAPGYTAASGLRATLTLSGQTLLSPAVQALPPPPDGSDLRTVTWLVRASGQALTGMTVTVQADSPAILDSASAEAVFSAAPPAPPDTPAAEAAAFVESDGSAVLQNGNLRLVFVRSSFGFGAAQVFARNGEGWDLAGGMAPLSRLTYRRPSGWPADLALVPSSVSARTQAGSASLTLFFNRTDPDGGVWSGSLLWRLEEGATSAAAEFTLSCTAPRELLCWNGPMLAAGNRSFGASKTEALFPGIEWLAGAERSSNSLENDPPLDLRVVPHPYRVTVPLMAVSSGSGVAALLWDPLQTWDGVNRYPNARFSSPNWLEGQSNHLMELFVPSIKGGWVAENGQQAGIPYSLPAGATLTLKAHVMARAQAGVLDAVDEWFRLFGVPPVPGGPGLLEQGLAAARTGLMETVWDPAANQWRHAVEWASGPAPEFAAALFADSLTETDPAARNAMRARVGAALSQQIASRGPASLGSSAASHIPEYRLPFFIGYLDEVMDQYQAEVASLIQTQQADGGWFVPVNPEMPRLVTPGTKELGSCANNARILLNHARLTGSPASRLAGLRALDHMDRYTIPRAAQTWEVPQHAPDILAAAWAVAAYLDGYLLTGDARYLGKARYWARAGLHFVYAWRAADRAIMDYATIPVLGSTHFVWSWLGLPVQWCGMVYAYYVERLADYDRSFPWRQVCEGITRSCIQQMNVSPYPGTYGDSINLIASNTPNGVYINPDNVYKCALKLTGRYGEVNRQTVTGGGRMAHVSSAARILAAAIALDGSQMYLRMGYPANETCFVMVYGLPLPAQVRKGSAALARVSDTDASPEGWSYDAASTRLIIRARMTGPQETIGVVLSGGFTPLQSVSVGQARSLPDGSPAAIRGVVSTGLPAGGTGLYVQAEDRSAGIRVVLASPSLVDVPAGTRVEAAGTVGTWSRERALLSAALRVESPGAPPEPLGVANRACCLGSGLSNNGLLVTTWGRVTAAGSGFFYVDDGSGLQDGTSTGGVPNRGIRVAGDAGAAAGRLVRVTGVSSVFFSGGQLRPLIRTRGPADIVPLD